ncbi:MAG: hypothetical protein ABI702_19400 [Burkholderiales bacterium]
MQVGVGWYTKSEWAKVKAAAVDTERFEETYAEWIQMAELALVELQATGVFAERSYIKATELLAWCLAHNKPNDGASRAEFVSEQERKNQEAGA